MIDNGGGLALVIFAIILNIITFIIIPSILATGVSVILRLIYGKINFKKLLFFWFITLLLIAGSIRFYLFLNIKLNGDNLI